MNEHNDNRKWPSIGKYVFIGFVLIAGYFLLTEHRAHTFGALPYLLLLACPLLHLFHGHGGHRGHGDARDEDKTKRKDGPHPGH